MAMDSAEYPPMPKRRKSAGASTVERVPIARQPATPGKHEDAPPLATAMTEPLPLSKIGKQYGLPAFLLPSLGGACFVVALLAVGTLVVLPWATQQLDHWHYGDARVSSLIANVGHGGTSHFFAQYWQGHVTIIEVVDSPSPRVHVYVQELLPSSDTAPRVVTLSVEDLIHNGKPDLLVSVEGVSLGIVFYNTGTAFSETVPQ